MLYYPRLQPNSKMRVCALVRFEPEQPGGALEHAVPDDILTRYYRDDDWARFRVGDAGLFTAQGMRVPCVVFENEDDVRTGEPDQWMARLEAVLGRLWELQRQLGRET